MSFDSNNPLGYLGINPVDQPDFICAQRAPTTNDIKRAGTRWLDESDASLPIYETVGQGVWRVGANAQATETVAGIARLATAAEATTGTDDTTIMTPAKVALVAIAGAPDATEVTKGIARLATTAEAQAATNDATIMTPLKVAAQLATPPAIGGTTPGAGTFTDLTADGTGAVSLGSNAAADFTVTGAFDLTLASTAGSLVVNAGEAAADAIDLNAASGGIDIDVALLASITSTRNNAQAILLESTAGGIDILASGSGGAGEDIDIICTGGSVNISGTENVADAVTISAANGGIDITCGGGAAEDIDIVNTAGSININAGEAAADAINIDSSGGIDADAAGQINLRSTQNAADAVVIESTLGGIQILASGAAAGEDILLTATGSSIIATSTENVANAIYLHANGGTSETVKIHSDQGTGVASIEVASDVGGVTISSGLASADAVNIVASNAAGGIDIDSGTAGVIVDTTGAISLDSAAASNFTVTGAFDLTLSSSAGSVNISAGEAAADALNVDAAAGGLDVDVALQMNLNSSQAAADAIRIFASNAAGGIDVDCGTGGCAIDSTGAVSIQGAAASDFSVSGAGIDLTLASASGRVVVNGEEAAADAVRLLSAAGGLDADFGLAVTLDGSAGISIDAATASNFSCAAGDMTIDATSGSLILSSGESAADSIVILSDAGGIDISAAAASAGEDIDITATGSSVNITSTENVSDAFVVNCSGAASGMSLTAGTSCITLSSGIINKVTSVNNAASPYTVLGTDSVLAVDTSAGAVTLTFPAAPSTGRTITVLDVGGTAGANNITLSGNGKNISQGASLAASKTLAANYSSTQMIYNGTFWSSRYTA